MQCPNHKFCKDSSSQLKKNFYVMADLLFRINYLEVQYRWIHPLQDTGAGASVWGEENELKGRDHYWMYLDRQPDLRADRNSRPPRLLLLSSSEETTEFSFFQEHGIFKNLLLLQKDLRSCWREMMLFQPLEKDLQIQRWDIELVVIVIMIMVEMQKEGENTRKRGLLLVWTAHPLCDNGK